MTRLAIHRLQRFNSGNANLLAAAKMGAYIARYCTVQGEVAYSMIEFVGTVVSDSPISTLRSLGSSTDSSAAT